jgi:hypothetical protein
LRLSRDEVSRIIAQFLDGSGGHWDWDDFISVPLDDPELERIRKYCGDLPDVFPPERPGAYCSERGLGQLRELADSLKS